MIHSSEGFIESQGVKIHYLANNITPIKKTVALICAWSHDASMDMGKTA